MNDIKYWQELNPLLHIEQLSTNGLINFSESVLKNYNNLLKKEGYVHIDVQDWNLDIEELSKTIVNLRTNKLPPLYAFIYDEYWLMFYKLDNFLRSVLGNGYLRLPDFWTWYIDHTKSESGWKPHRDKGRHSLNFDGSPKSVTIWIPLTDSTTLNSCMYIIPADRDPTYNTDQESVWGFYPADIRALPATAGSVFCWNQAVLHWGSHSSERAEHSRISMAVEFQQGNMPPYNLPISSPEIFPTFDQRIELINKQISQYRHML